MTVNKDGQQVEEWLELANGCICCSVKDSGVAAIESLISRRGSFDYILLETTGLADPGNIAPLFWVDDGLGSSIYLDGVVTLVDAKNFFRSLRDKAWKGEGFILEQDTESPVVGSVAVSGLQHQTGRRDDTHGKHFTTAHLQVSHADVIIVNKVDLVSQTELDAVLETIRSINALAKILQTTHSHVEQLEGSLLDLHAYDDVTALGMERVTRERGHTHFDETISTITLTFPSLTQVQFHSLELWLRSICWENELSSNSDTSNDFEVHRIKGRIPLQTGQVMMLQGVREIFDIRENERAVDERDKNVVEGKIVVIGRGLHVYVWQQSINGALKAAKE